jgi:ATP-binding cassette subfamily C (CFTR/MRP) protein 1
VLLVLWASTRQLNQLDGPYGQVTIAANTLGILDAIALCVLSLVEHRQSIRPSSIISLYLLFSVAFDAVQCRSLWLLPEGQKLHTIAAVFSVSAAFKVGILVLEAKEKRAFLVPPWNQAPPESLSGTINRSVFWWLNSLFLRGYKGVLGLDSLWPTDHYMDSEQLLARLNLVWNKTADKKKKNVLAFSLLRSIKWPLVAMIFPRLCLVGLRFSQPLLLNSVVSFVSQSNDKNMDIGYGLIGATALIYLGNGVSSDSSGMSSMR